MKYNWLKIAAYGGILMATTFMLKCTQTANSKMTGTSLEALLCMNQYIDSVKHSYPYTSALESFNRYLINENIILNRYGSDMVTHTIDSAVLFNKQMDYSCLILLVRSLEGLRNDYASIYHATLIENEWIISEGMNFIYQRKKDAAGNYIPYDLDYLSNETRLEFIKDGFFKNKDCEINWNYVEKWQE